MDTMVRIRERVRDFLEMGVREVWVVNPGARSALVHAGASTMEQNSGKLQVPETAITLAVADIFSVLDEHR